MQPRETCLRVTELEHYLKGLEKHLSYSKHWHFDSRIYRCEFQNQSQKDEKFKVNSRIKNRKPRIHKKFTSMEWASFFFFFLQDYQKKSWFGLSFTICCCKLFVFHSKGLMLCHPYWIIFDDVIMCKAELIWGKPNVNKQNKDIYYIYMHT